MSSPPEGKLETKAGHPPAEIRCEKGFPAALTPGLTEACIASLQGVLPRPPPEDPHRQRLTEDVPRKRARFRKMNVKAGGMRIVQKHPHSGDTKEEKDKDDQEWESPSPPKPTVFISGVIARGDKDFPPAAAQVAHQKPHASIDRHPSPRTQHIQQPRK